MLNDPFIDFVVEVLNEPGRASMSKLTGSPDGETLNG